MWFSRELVAKVSDGSAARNRAKRKWKPDLERAEFGDRNAGSLSKIGRDSEVEVGNGAELTW